MSNPVKDGWSQNVCRDNPKTSNGSFRASKVHSIVPHAGLDSGRLEALRDVSVQEITRTGICMFHTLRKTNIYVNNISTPILLKQIARMGAPRSFISPRNKSKQ